MRILSFLILILSICFFTGACKSGSGPQPFCDTTCNNDSVKFNYEHPLKPYVYISVKDCIIDTIVWSHNLLATNRKIDLDKDVRVNKDNVAAIFRDTAYAWLKFNDCITGRGFLLKLPFEKDEKMSIYTSALNNFDPKFSVEDGLISYFDHTFVYAQDPQTGKVEKLKLNDSRLDINYDKVHDTFDSVNITRDRIYVKFKLNNADKELEKPINLNP